MLVMSGKIAIQLLLTSVRTRPGICSQCFDVNSLLQGDNNGSKMRKVSMVKHMTCLFFKQVFKDVVAPWLLEGSEVKCAPPILP